MRLDRRIESVKWSMSAVLAEQLISAGLLESRQRSDRILVGHVPSRAFYRRMRAGG